MKNKKNNTGFAVINIILVSLVILLTGYIVYDKVLSNKKDDNNSVETKKENKTDSNVDVDKIGKQLFEKYGDYVYSSKNLNYSSLHNEIKLEMALLNSNGIIYNENFKHEFENMDWSQVNEEGMAIYPYYLKLNIKDFENSYRDLFGQDKNINYEEFSTLAFTTEELTLPFNCKKEDSHIVCYPFDGGGDWAIMNAFNYDYAEIMDDKLNVYVNYLGLNEPGEGKLCSDYECQNLIDDIIYQNEDLNNNNKSKVFEKYKDKTGVYKLVFNKDSNDNWYWEETQIVKK